MAGRLCGLLNLNKPAGMTSRAAIDRVARPLRGTKVGHAGTLDPLATGVLVVCVGAATRLIEFVQRMPKTYRTVIRLGATSDTLDADGAVTEVAAPRRPDEEEVRAVVARQVGTIEQMPPRFSALKVGGRRAYDLARAGEEVALASRRVTIARIDVLGYEWPRLELEIDCGGGTYIRSIARDLGDAIGCGGLVEALVRTRIGPFDLAGAIDPDALSVGTIPGRLMPALAAVADLPRVALSAGQVADVTQGRPIDPDDPAAVDVGAGEVALVGPDGMLVAVAERVDGTRLIAPRRVLAGA